MKKTLLLLAALVAAMPALGQTLKKVSDLTRDTTPTTSWLIMTSDPAGTAEPHAITAANLKAWAIAGLGAGTLTDVAGVSNAPFLTIARSAATGTGTITIGLTTGQTANRFLATPNGSTGTVSLRAIVAADLPDLSGTYATPASLAAALAAYTGSTALVTLGTISAGTWQGTAIADSYIASAATWSAKEPALGNPAGNGYVLSSTTGGTRSWIAAGGTGTVASVALTAPAILTVSGSPVTASGTLALTLATQAANKVLAGPTAGADAAPTMRLLVAADIPDLSATYQPLNAALTALAANTGTVDFSGLALTLPSSFATLTGSQALTNKSVNGITITSSTGTLTIASGKTLTASNTLTFAGTDGGTLNVGTGGTLGTAAFTAATAYEVPITFSTGLTRTTNTVTVNTSQNIATLSNLTGNGFVKTSGGTGGLSIDTATYLTTTGNGSSITGLTQSQVAGLTTTSTPNFSNVQVTASTLTYAGTTTIDFTGDGFRTVTLTGNITFASSNLAAGKSITVRIVGDSSSRTLAFPAWKFVGAAAPTALAANKTAILTVTSFSTTDTACVAAYAVEP